MWKEKAYFMYLCDFFHYKDLLQDDFVFWKTVIKFLIIHIVGTVHEKGLGHNSLRMGLSQILNHKIIIFAFFLNVLVLFKKVQILGILLFVCFFVKKGDSCNITLGSIRQDMHFLWHIENLSLFFWHGIFEYAASPKLWWQL